MERSTAIKNRQSFQVSWRMIWGSSLVLSILASIPKIFQEDATLPDVLFNSSISFVFSLFIWYYNIYALPKFTARRTSKNFITGRLFISVLMGIITMILIVIAHQELFLVTQMDQPIMYEIRAVLINLIIYMFLHLLFQNYKTQQIGFELERSLAANLGSQYELLKQQVNPHFLFNSLNTLKSMVDMQDPHSADFILKLSDFYRFTLESRKLDLIPLEEELEILESYVYLLKARFEDGFILENQIDPKYYQCDIPPFALQLLIENGIKHNVVSLDKPLKIRLYSQDNFVVVENEIMPKIGTLSTGVGLDNINQRFLHLIGKEIEIEKDETTFRVKIPMTYDCNNN
jgi:two-component system LytT family sensor kinase